MEPERSPRALPAFAPDPVIEEYKKDIDRTLLRENLKRTPEERLRQLMELQRFAEELRDAGRRARGRRPITRGSFRRSPEKPACNSLVD